MVAFCVYNLTLEIYADDVNYPVKISRVDITPDPVVRARPATFKISAATGNLFYYYYYYTVFLNFHLAFLAGTKLVV